MQREDIITGIKQAIERGSSLEKAKQSFINAGYSQQDVEDSSRVFLGVSSAIPRQMPIQVPNQLPPLPAVQPQVAKPRETIILPSTPPVNQVQQKSKGTGMLIFIILLAIILMLLLAFLVATIFYKEEVAKILEPIFPSLITIE